MDLHNFSIPDSLTPTPSDLTPHRIRAKINAKRAAKFKRISLPKIDNPFYPLEGYYENQVQAWKDCLAHYRKAIEKLQSKDKCLRNELTNKGIDIEDPELEVEKAFLVTWNRKTHKHRHSMFLIKSEMQENPQSTKNDKEEKIESKGDTLSKSEEIADFNEEQSSSNSQKPLHTEYDPILFEEEGIVFSPEPAEGILIPSYIPPAFAQVFGT